jgi:replication factor A2
LYSLPRLTLRHANMTLPFQKREEQQIRPVTIKQMLDTKEAYPGAELIIDNTPSTQVTFVGQVRSVNAGNINVNYRIDDGTGMIDCKRWPNTHGVPDDDGTAFPPNTYVRIIGRLQSFHNKRNVNVNYIRTITDFNEVNYHLLEATYIHLTLTKGAGVGAGAGAQHDANAAGAYGGGGESMFVDSYGGGGAVSTGDQAGLLARLGHVSRTACTMYQYMLSNGEQTLSSLKARFGLSEQEVLAAVGELVDNGNIYTTQDDETWAVLDA